MTQSVFNDRLRQLLILAIIIIIAGLLIGQLSVFLPGLLGGITFYILSRATYFKLVFKRKWKKGGTALLFIIVYLILIALPVYLSITLISPKINDLLRNQDKIVQKVQLVLQTVSAKTGVEITSTENIRTATQKISALVPMLLGGTATILANVFMMFFILFFLLIGGRQMEKNLSKIIPLQPHNIDSLASETKMMIKANALGIPIICIVQGICASLGYFIFGLEEWGLWGFITGVFAFFPLVGTMIIWVPLVIFLFAQGQTWPAIGLAVYSIIITGNVDYVARISFMKRIGNVHPLITVLGVIVGLNLFGFIGLIFGPLLISYFLVMVKIYINEFTNQTAASSINKVIEGEDT